MSERWDADAPAGTTVSKQRSLAIRRRTLSLHRAAIWCGLVAFVVVALAPFLYVISTSLKQTTSLFQYPPQWIPSPVYFGNYQDLVEDRPFLRWTFNSVFVAGTVTLVKVLFDSMAGYALARIEFRGRTALFWIMLLTVMIPPAVLIVPLFFLVRDAGLLDTYWALILPPLANPVGIFLMRAYIQGLPADLENAARIDNCGPFATYWRIILPLVKPGLVVVGTYTFLIQYVNFVWPLVATSSEEMFLLTNGLASLRTRGVTQDWGLISAASVLSMIPITIVFLLFQKQFVSASLSGAVKE